MVLGNKRYEPEQLRARFGPRHTPWPIEPPSLLGTMMTTWGHAIYRRDPTTGAISSAGRPYRELYINGQKIYGQGLNEAKADLFAYASHSDWKTPKPPTQSSPLQVLERRFDSSWHMIYAAHNIPFFFADSSTIPGQTKGEYVGIIAYIRVWTP